MYARGGGISPPTGVDITPLGGGYQPPLGWISPPTEVDIPSLRDPPPSPHLKVLPPPVMRLIIEVGYDPDNGH